MENVTNGGLFVRGDKVNKHYRPLFANRIYMSHPENKRSMHQRKYFKVNSESDTPSPKSHSTSLPNLEDSDKGRDNYTQTSKTILQLAELEAGNVFPDSLTSSPTKYPNPDIDKINDFKNLTSCSENFDISIPYVRKGSVKNYLDECYDTQISPRDKNYNTYPNVSLTSTFLAKKRNEDLFPVCGCRSRFLQQTSPLRNLSSCTPKSNIKTPTYFEANTSDYHISKNSLPPSSRFTVKRIKNQETLDDVPFLSYWPKSEIIDKKVEKLDEKGSSRKLHVNKRRSSFMSPTIASEQRNQQNIVKSFDRLMSPTKRGRSLSPNRLSYLHPTVNKDSKIPFADDIHSESSSYKLDWRKGRKKHQYTAAKSSSLLSEYVSNNQLTTTMSRLNMESPQVRPSLPSSTTSTENLIFQIMGRVKDDDWNISVQGLAEVSDCCRTMDTDLLYPHMTVVNQKLLQLLRSPRSHVCRTTCQIAGHLFETMKDTRRPEFDDIVEALLAKTADSNKFIRKDANLSLDCMVTHIPIYHAVRSLCLKGPVHKNPLVRTATVRLIVCSVVITGPDIILGLPGHEPTRKRIMRLFPQFMFDKHLETRKYGERLLKIFSKEQNFDYFLKKYLDSNDVNRINNVLKTRMFKR